MVEERHNENRKTTREKASYLQAFVGGLYMYVSADGDHGFLKIGGRENTHNV